MIHAPLLMALAPALSAERAAEIAATLQAAALPAGITTRLRVAAFVAQLAHESGGFRYLQELWGPTPAQTRYEGRADLGNLQSGDGHRYRGRGWIQLTGRHNYRTYGALLGLPLEDDPDLAASPDTAARIAAAYWTQRGLNALADIGDLEAITRRINGGLNGYAERFRLYQAALSLLLPPAPPKGDTMNLIHNAAQAAIRREFKLPSEPSWCLKAARLIVERGMGWKDMGLYTHLVTEKVDANKTGEWWAVDAEKSVLSRGLGVPTYQSPVPGDLVFNHSVSRGHVGVVVEHLNGLYVLENAEVSRGIKLYGAVNLCPLHLWGGVTAIARLPAAEVPATPTPLCVVDGVPDLRDMTGQRREFPSVRGITINAERLPVRIALNLGGVPALPAKEPT